MIKKRTRNMYVPFARLKVCHWFLPFTDTVGRRICIALNNIWRRTQNHLSLDKSMMPPGDAPGGCGYHQRLCIII